MKAKRHQKDNGIENEGAMMTTGEHLEVFRKILIRILIVAFSFSILAFIYKDFLFKIIFAPSQSDFILYRLINRLILTLGGAKLPIQSFNVSLINTELATQFMTHIKISFYFGLIASSPYAVYKLFGFVQPALYERERKYSGLIVFFVYLLFSLGLLMNYFVIFPISFRFLGTYQVSDIVVNTITLSSYIYTLVLLSFTLGLVFEIPILAFVLGKMGLVTAEQLKKWRKYAFVGIMVLAAFITPPDLFSLVLMTIPLYGLYEISIHVLKFTHASKINQN